MNVHLSFLLILTGLTGIHSITTVSEVSVKAGDSITIPCLYAWDASNHVKYLCEGYFWYDCTYAVKTNQPHNSGKFSISDDKTQSIFTVTMKNVTEADAHYWCAVELYKKKDFGEYFHLSVTTGMPRLYVDHQEIIGFNGDSVNISCHYRNSGEIKWCRLGRACVTGSAGSIDGTRVTISASVPSVFTVTMSGLTTESRGWYLCVKGDLQMPVHLTVTEKPTTDTHRPKNSSTSICPTHSSDHSTAQELRVLESFLIRLSLLTFIVMVGIFVWFLFKRYRQTTKESTTTMESHAESDAQRK